MMNDKDIVHFHHLFIAAPELLFDKAVLKWLKQKGVIGDEELAQYESWAGDAKRVKKVLAAVKNKPVWERIVAIAPEVLSVSTIDFLRTHGVITSPQGHILRLALRSLGPITSGGVPKDRAEIIMRAKKLLGVGLSEEMVALMRSLDVIDVTEANRLRALLLTGNWTLDTAKKLKQVKSLTDMLALAGNGLMDPRLVQAMKLVGLINSKTANAIIAAMSYGSATWQVWQDSRRAQGLAARMAYVVSGSFSWESLAFLEAAGLIDERQKFLLKWAVMASQTYNRQLMEQMTARRYRVLSGEAPIVTYARASKETNSQLLRLLAEAARDARKKAEALHGARGDQLNLRAKALHEAMRQVWEGTGYLTIAGEREVAAAALESQEALMARYSERFGEYADTMLKYQARSGLDSYISRQENTLKLASTVYGNWNLFNGRVDKEINKALLRGASAKELGDAVSRFISPTTPGGISYAAMRVGRTELANAFHFTTIRHTREMPWVRGYKWNLSGSHSRPDKCNEYADNDHSNMGPGVFKKADVPDKPHPQCMCYLTVVMPNEDDFIKSMNKGRYDRYMNTMMTDGDAQATMTQRLLNQSIKLASTAATQALITQGVRVGTRMLDDPNYSPFKWNPLHPDVSHLKALSKEKASLVRAQITALKAKGVKFRKLPSGDEVPEALVEMVDEGVLAERALVDQRQRTLEGYFHQFIGAPKEMRAAYDDILPDRSPFIEDPTDQLSKAMYGSSSYRVINGRLRLTNGDLVEYNRAFADPDMIADLQDLDHTDPNFGAKLNEIVARFSVDKPNHPSVSQISIDGYNQQLLTALNPMARAQYGYPDIDFTTHSDIVRTLDRNMERIDRPMGTWRVSGDEFFGLGRPLTADDVGMVFKDHGFTSTEGMPNYYDRKSVFGLDLTTRHNKMRIFSPAGTMMTRINDFEYELLLSRGTTFQVTSVQQEGSHNLIDLVVLAQDEIDVNGTKFDNPIDHLWPNS